MGPELQYSNEKPADPIELRIYPGADADFTLYEDEGDSYRYEKGAFATIPIHWNNQTHTLTIGARKGSFPGMLTQRTFHIVVVNQGTEMASTPLPCPTAPSPMTASQSRPKCRLSQRSSSHKTCSNVSVAA